MHHSVNVEEIRDARDRFFADYWAGIPATRIVFRDHETFREVLEHGYQKGFFQGLTLGFQHGAKLVAVQIANDVVDAMGGELPEGEI